MRLLAALIVLTCGALPVAHAMAGGPSLSVVSVQPQPHSRADYLPEILIDFDRNVFQPSVTAAPQTFTVFGENSGPMTGTLSFQHGSRLRFVPDEPFRAGERVHVVLSHDVQASDGSMLRQAGYAFDFLIRARSSGMEFHPAEGLQVRDDPAVRVRVYGGTGSDFDDDGFTDIALITEDASDCRMVRNRADGTCHLVRSSGPSVLLGDTPSPSESSDFNVDGMIDMVATNVLGASFTYMIGTGDGSFAAPQTMPVHPTPRGLAVLEANGDGFPDIVTANFGSGEGEINVSLNDTLGSFLPPLSFDAGGVGEWAVATADMDLDGIYDLVVGLRTIGMVHVMHGNGDGTFTLLSTQSIGGGVWRLFLGDVDGDGDMDVTTANGTSATASVLRNDGSGNLLPAQNYATASFVVAPDLGDLDGDGDLDWVLSCFGGGVWEVYTNDGAGNFAFDQSFDAVLNPACCIIMDVDNDNDLDLVLLDELADIVTVQENKPRWETLFCFGDGTGAACPCSGEEGWPGRGCDNSANTGGVNLAAVHQSYLSFHDGTGIVEVQATGFRPDTMPTVILVRALQQNNNGLGSVLGDGLFCLEGSVTRMRTDFATGGLTSFVIRHQAGAGLYDYQIAYRDTATFCSPAVFNFSNGLQLVWP